MKRFLKKIFIFIIAIVIVDLLFGAVCHYMNSHSKGGGIRNRYYICKESNEDILIFGSSRALHHYVPDIIEDSLNLSCYNAGEEGNGIILSCGYLKMILARYTPKVIIYDISAFDIYKDDNVKYLNLLKPFYSEPGVDSLFWYIDPKSRIKMHSSLYMYNTTCLGIIGNYILPMANYPKGYLALSGQMDYEPSMEIDKNREVDPIKISLFENFIKTASSNNIQVFCLISPIYGGSGDNYRAIKELCIRLNVPFLDYSSSSYISNDKSLFQDLTHMNDLGARKYTSIIASRLKSYIDKDK